jgi:multidrug efflux pump subunit AcrA (membrane-fusion protein)
MRKRYWLLAAVIIFVAVNAMFIGFDKKGKVDRLAYIKSWTAAGTKDLHEKYEIDGIVDYGEASNVYFEGTAGTFKEFLVKEGEAVKAGDPLFILCPGLCGNKGHAGAKDGCA